jgi:hypothetical protein
MIDTKVKIYIGCSLTHAPAEFKQAVEDLKVRLRPEYEVFDFLGLEKGTDQDVYNWDIHQCVEKCDLFLAICDHASLGLGYELGSAIEAFKKPVLAVAHTDAYISRLVVGIDSPLFSFERYSDLSEIEAVIRSKLKSVKLT